MSLYEEVKATGGYISNHESDLYIEVNPTNQAILDKYPPFKKTATTFLNQDTKQLCWDIPFAFNPFWEKAIFSRVTPPNEV
jgi:hypothetical protein